MRLLRSSTQFVTHLLMQHKQGLWPGSSTTKDDNNNNSSLSKTNKRSFAPLKKICLFTPSQRRLPCLSARRAQTFLACAAQMVTTPQKAERLTVDVSGFWIYRNLVRASAPAGLLCIQNPKQIQQAINILWTTSLSGKGDHPEKMSCAVTLVVSPN